MCLLIVRKGLKERRSSWQDVSQRNPSSEPQGTYAHAG